MKRTLNILAAASMATCALWLVAPAAAAPITSSMGLQNALAPSVETVQYRRGWGHGYRGYGYRGYRYRGYGYGLGLGLGAIVTQPYYYAPYYYGGQPYAYPYYQPYSSPYSQPCPAEYASRPELCPRY